MIFKKLCRECRCPTLHRKSLTYVGGLPVPGEIECLACLARRLAEAVDECEAIVASVASVGG